MEIKTKGYYVSEPVHWVDCHASLKFEGNSFYIIKFNSTRCFFDSVNDIDSINVNNMLQKENYGLYEIHGNIVEIRYNPDTEFEVKRVFTIASTDVLLDEELTEYRYVDTLSYLNSSCKCNEI